MPSTKEVEEETLEVKNEKHLLLRKRAKGGKGGGLD